jgi:hypothetical protein
MPDDILVIGGSGNPKLMRKIGELPSRAVMIRATGLEELWALRALAEISSHRDPPDTETADASYRRTGKREQAKKDLTTATTMYREMGMKCWLEKTEVEIAELG